MNSDTDSVEKKDKKSEPLTKEEDVQKNPDPHIDQDFPGFPHSPSGKNNIKRPTREDKKSEGLKPRSKKRK